MKKIIGLLIIIFIIPIVCHAHAGMYDRYLDMVACVKGVLNTIFVSQILVYLIIRFNCLKSSKRIRMRLLLLAKRLCKNWWINLLAAWALSSFVLTSYLDVFCLEAFIGGIIIFFLFGCFYLFAVLRKKMRRRLLSGMKAIYFYLIASIGQIIGFGIYYFAYTLKWYGPYNKYTDLLWDLLGYKLYRCDDGGYILLKGMMDLAFCLAVPYFVLVIIKAVRFAKSYRKR